MKYVTKGFSLIKISIVLSIIGILMSFTIKGHGLIELAKSRSVITQIENYKSAIDIFIEKYNGFPGDIQNADTVIGNNAQSGQMPSNISDNDIKRFWNNLIKSGLITASTINGFPTTKLGGILLLKSDANGDKWIVLCATNSTAKSYKSFLSKDISEKIMQNIGSSNESSGDGSIILQKGEDEKYYLMFKIN